MNYDEALNYIHSRPRMRNNGDYTPLKKLLAYLGNPQEKLKFVHIAGTNGKGSCAAMCANVLKTAGYKVGMNISPFVVEFRERIQINGRYIPREKLAEITERVKFFQEKILREDGLPLREFEIVTAISFVYFEMENCDIVCLEVGVGGLHDATNVISDSLVSCIMNISYDHTDYLGDTLEKIARQKAGIIKPGRAVVCYPAMDFSALSAIKQIAREKNSPVILPDINCIKNTHSGFMQSVLEYKNFKITQSFTGIHQSYNAAVVIETMLQLRHLGYTIRDRDIVKGIETTAFPARIEVISRDPLIIIDGGHNADGISALIKVLEENKLKNLTAVWSTLSDKHPENIIKMMSPYISALYTVELPGNKRALSSQKLAEMAEGAIPKVIPQPDIGLAIHSALKNPGGGLLIFGSLYLASDARNYLLKLKK